MTRKPRYMHAIHEAGHVIATELQGDDRVYVAATRVYDVGIGPEREKIDGVWCDMPGPARYGETLQHLQGLDPDQRAVARIAGVAAELIAGVPMADAIAGSVDDLPPLFDRAKDNAELTRWLMTAIELLRKNWPAVVAIADALDARGELLADDVRAVLAAPLPDAEVPDADSTWTFSAPDLVAE